jgi:hypothetical protein
MDLLNNNNNMKIYEIGYWSHDEAPKILLTCDKEYTQEQFNDLVTDIISDIGVKEIEKNGYFDSSFESVLLLLYEELQQYGFNEIKADVKLRPFGWASLTEDDWKHGIPETDDLNILREKIRQKLNYE